MLGQRLKFSEAEKAGFAKQNTKDEKAPRETAPGTGIGLLRLSLNTKQHMKGKTKQCVGETPKKLGKNDQLQQNCKLNKLKKKKTRSEMGHYIVLATQTEGIDT